MENTTDDFVKLLAEILQRLNTLELEVSKFNNIETAKSFANKIKQELMSKGIR